ncbi:MAG: hypothetical protein HY428_02395 [Candidatus Levybacteria bacterium]|nr:hypothetical protein [Candidatus Levybacteria bacterium]
MAVQAEAQRRNPIDHLRYAKGRLLSRLQPQAIELDRGERAEYDYAPWFQCPPIVLVGEAQNPLGLDGTLLNQLERGKEEIYAQFTIAAAERLGYAPLRWEEIKQQVFPSPTSGKEGTPYGVVISSVYLGELSNEAKNAMREVTAVENERKEKAALLGEIYEPMFLDGEERRPYLHKLRDSIPQVLWPYVQTIGGEVIKHMKLDSKAKANATKAIFVDDTDGVIGDLPSHWKQAFHWMMMGKFGSFKTMIVRYERRDGQLHFHTPMLATLEGGHIELDPGEMMEQLAIFGSARATEKAERLKDEYIPRAKWDNSNALIALKRLGHLLRDFKFISPGIEVDDMVSEDNMNIGDHRGVVAAAEKVASRVKRDIERARGFRKRAAGYAGQQEGAYGVFDPELGVFVCNVSGRFRSVKVDPGAEDVMAVRPVTDDPTKVYVIPVEGIDPNGEKGPSVEADEFAEPIYGFLTRKGEGSQQYRVFAKRVEGGYVLLDELAKNGKTFVAREDIRELPAVLGIVHMHRDYESFMLPDGDELIEIVLEDDMVVGCGVDLMRDKSRRAMEKAVQLWNEGGRKAKAALFRVGRHGLNVFVFPTADESGFIPEYIFQHFDDMVRREDNKLVLLHEVRQEKKENNLFVGPRRPQAAA